MRGKLIVLDGTDGSGKATQTKLLLAHLKKEKYQTLAMDFPQYYKSFFGKMVGRYLTGEFGNYHEVNPYLASILYAADRWEAKNSMIKALKQGKIVIANRYVSANMGFQAAKLTKNKRKKFLQWLEKMEYEVFGISKEDIVLFLYIPAKISQKLVDEKSLRQYLGSKKRDIHEQNLTVLQEVQNYYRALCDKYSHWRLINCLEKGRLLSPEAVHQKIWQVVREVL